jgi:hypothetical protein
MICRSEELDQLLDTVINKEIIKQYLKLLNFNYFVAFHPDFMDYLSMENLEKELSGYQKYEDDTGILIGSYKITTVSFHRIIRDSYRTTGKIVGKRVYFINAEPKEIITKLNRLHNIKALL